MNKSNYIDGSFPMTNMDDTVIMKPLEVAEYLRVGKNTIYDLLKSGELSGLKIGKTWLIPKEAVVLFVRKQSGLIK